MKLSGTWNATNEVLAFAIFVSIVFQVKTPSLHSSWYSEDEQEVYEEFAHGAL